MKVNVNTPESWKAVLDFEVPSEEVGEAVDKKIADYRKKVKMPGFRPGKVPENIVRTRYGDAIRAEVVESLIQKSYEKACKDEGITPVSEAKVKELSADEGKPLTFSIETEVDPEIEIKGYDKVKVKPKPKKIAKSEVNAAIDDLRERMAEFVDVDRPVEKGDYIRFEYVDVKVDGETKADLTSPNYPIEIGSSKIKEFDKGLIGHPAGETVTMNIKFPPDYGDEELAGKKAEMTVKITKVQEKRLPELNEEFLKKIGDFENEEKLREFIEKDLQERENQKARNDAYNKAIDQLLEKNKFDVPPSRIERYLDAMHQEMTQYARGQQEVPAREEMDERYRESAEKTIRRYRAIGFIANKENIRPTQEEVDAEIRKLAERYGQPFDEVKQALRRNGTTERIRSDLREQKTLNFLIGESEEES